MLPVFSSAERRASHPNAGTGYFMLNSEADDEWQKMARCRLSILVAAGLEAVTGNAIILPKKIP